MVKPRRNIRKVSTTTWTLTESEVHEALRAYVGAPPAAEVVLDCGYDGFFREATVTWSETEEDGDY